MVARRALPAVLALALTACAGTASDGGLTPIDAPADRVAAIVALDARVGRVFHRLITANVDQCPDVGWTAGWTLHAASQYEGALRDVLVLEGLHGDLPAVSSTAPDGPADLAALGRGDVIMSVNGVALDAGRPAGRAQYEGVEANLDILGAAVALGAPVALTVRRDGADRVVRLTPTPACDYAVHLDVSDALNARADGSSVHISSALARFAATDDELAVILGHELAHNVLEHRESLDRQAPARRVFGNLAVPPGQLERAERDADRIGLYLMAQAGFAYEVAPAFWRRFGEANWRVRWAQWGYPSASVRADRLEAVVGEIRAGGQSGLKLTR